MSLIPEIILFGLTLSAAGAAAYFSLRSAQHADVMQREISKLTTVESRLAMLETDFLDKFESFAKTMRARTQKREKIEESEELNNKNGGIVGYGPVKRG